MFDQLNQTTRHCVITSCRPTSDVIFYLIDSLETTLNLLIRFQFTTMRLHKYKETLVYNSHKHIGFPRFNFLRHSVDQFFLGKYHNMITFHLLRRFIDLVDDRDRNTRAKFYCFSILFNSKTEQFVFSASPKTHEPCLLVELVWHAGAARDITFLSESRAFDSQN